MRKFVTALLFVLLATAAIYSPSVWADDGGVTTGWLDGTDPDSEAISGDGDQDSVENWEATKAEYTPIRGLDVASDRGDLRLSLPADLHDDDLEISITPTAFSRGASTRTLRTWDLAATAKSDGTDVSQFKRPLLLEFSYTEGEMAGLDVDTLRIVYLDESTDTWVTLPSIIDVHDRTVTAETDHFSIYGTQAESAYALPGQVMNFQADLHSGAATYSIPIEYPAGSNGWQPVKLNLNYNSGSVDEMKNERDVGSWVGVGWSLDLPHVSYNEEMDTYSLSMNGLSAELIESSTANTWYTNPDLNLKVTSSGSPISGFQVWDRDGNKYRFGTNSYAIRHRFADSCDTTNINYRFDLFDVVSPNGMRTDITWDETDVSKSGCQAQTRESVPTYLTIRYDVDAWKYVVKFNSSVDRPDIPGTVQPDIVSLRRLDSIDVQEWNVSTSQGNFRTYEFEYDDDTEAYDSGLLDADLNTLEYAGQLLLTDVTTNDLTTVEFAYDNKEINFLDDSVSPDVTATVISPYLETITNEFGAKITFTFEENPSSPVAQIWSRNVVTEISADPDDADATDGVAITTTYDYLDADGDPTDPVYKAAGNNWTAEYRGFPNVKVTNADDSYSHHWFFTTGWTSITHPVHGGNSRDGDRLKGKNFQIERFTSSDKKLNLDYWDWRIETIDAPKDIYENQIANYGTETWNAAGTSIDSTRWIYKTYDDYGNVTKIDDRGAWNITNDELTTYYGYTPNTTDWIVNRKDFQRIYKGISDDDEGSSLRSETHYFYDEEDYEEEPTEGNLTKVRSYTSSGNYMETEIAYDSRGNVSSTTDANGNTTTYTYDSHHNWYQTGTTAPSVDGVSFTTATTWIGVLGLPETVTDVNGEDTTYFYDDYGRIEEIVEPLDDTTNPTTKFSYLDWGTAGDQRIKREQKSTGSTYTWSEEYFDGFGRPVQVRSQDVGSNSLVSGTPTFDDNGRLTNTYANWSIASSTATGYLSPPVGTLSVAYEYDALGRVTKVTGLDGSETSTSYDGLETTITDAVGTKRVSEVDAFGRQISVVERNESDTAEHREVLFTYDTLGNLTETVVDPITDENVPKVRTYMYYDWLGRKTSMDDDHMGDWSYTYDDNSNLLTQNDGRSTVLKFEYDDLNRETKRCETDCSTGTVLNTFEYDDTGIDNAIGRRTKMIEMPDDTGYDYDRTYAYDVRGRVTSETQTIDGTEYTTAYTYDSDNSPTTVTLPNSEQINVIYDDVRRPYSVTSSDVGTIVTSTDYNILGLPTQTDFGNGTRTDREYWGIEHTGSPASTSYGQIYRINTSVISGGAQRLDLKYTWDSMGNLTKREDVTRSTTENFTYDWLDRLTSADAGVSVYQQGYGYDGFDRPTTFTDEFEFAYSSSTKPYQAIGNYDLGTQDGLIHRWSMNGGTADSQVGIVRDLGSDDADLTMYNTPNINNSGEDALSHQADFRNSTAYLENSGDLGIDVEGDFTISFWAKIEDNGSGFDHVLGLGDSHEFTFYVNQDTMPSKMVYKMEIGGVNREVGWGPNVVDDVWTHYALTYEYDSVADESSIRFWIDGVLKATPVYSGKLGLSSSDITLGKAPSGSGDWQGTLDEVRLYDRRISNAEVKELGPDFLPALSAYTYDANGNALTADCRTMVWTAENQLSTTTNASTCGTDVVTNEYDGDGTRVMRSTTSGGSTTDTHYVNQWYQVNDAGGTPAPIITYWHNGSQVATNDGTTTEWLHTDHLGSPAAATGSAGTLLWERREYPFGDARVDTGTPDTERLFTGQIEDEDAGLYFFNARFLETGVGLFISPDSIVPNPSDPRDHNRYSYVKNNPLKYTDPSGHLTCSYEGEFDGCDENPWKNCNHQDNPVPCETRNSTGDALAHTSDPSRTETTSDLVYPLAESDYEMRPWYEFVELATFVIPTGWVGNGIVRVGGRVFVKLLNTKTGVTVLKQVGVAANKAKGDWFEELVGVAGSKTGIKMFGSYRYPDLINEANKSFHEAKNVRKLSLTPQMKVYINFARDFGWEMKLSIRTFTKLSGPLERALNSIGAKIVRW
jgi:RHS repeat-associated protein